MQMRMLPPFWLGSCRRQTFKAYTNLTELALSSVSKKREDSVPTQEARLH